MTNDLDRPVRGGKVIPALARKSCGHFAGSAPTNFTAR